MSRSYLRVIVLQSQFYGLRAYEFALTWPLRKDSDFFGVPSVLTLFPVLISTRDRSQTLQPGAAPVASCLVGHRSGPRKQSRPSSDNSTCPWKGSSKVIPGDVFESDLLLKDASKRRTVKTLHVQVPEGA